jgi:hypothetical protein
MRERTRRLLATVGAGGFLLGACGHQATAPGGGTGGGFGPSDSSLLLTTIPIAPNYGVHDTFIRDGIAAVCAWNSGVLIYDVGNGLQGGTPAAPKLVSQFVPSANGISGGAQIHNAWWFWNPGTGEHRYLFLGQEAPGTIGSSSAGDIHVLDVSDLVHPAEVAFYHSTTAGTHNFWMNESAQILYAAFYNGGVIALDVSGALSGDLSSRLISSVQPGGPGDTYTWGVQLYNGSLYAIDMLSGLWQLSESAGHLDVAGGGNNVPDRYSSDFSIAAGYAYSGSWDHYRRTGLPGSAVSIWRLGVTGAPALVDTIAVDSVGAISDIKVSPDGKLLMFSTEAGPASGMYFYSLANPGTPAYLSRYLTGPEGVHTAKWGEIGGRLYAFGAKNPSNPALLILDVTNLDR